MERGQELHLDHRDGGGPHEYLGWSHAACNLRAASVQRDLRAAARVAAGRSNSQPMSELNVSQQQVPSKRPPVTCKFHDPPLSHCPHSRDWLWTG
jgi:hypothetical protein